MRHCHRRAPGRCPDAVLSLTRHRARGLQAYALQTVALLKDDRNAAIRRGMNVATLVDPDRRAIRSGATGSAIRIPDDVRFDALLPRTCNRQAAFSTISFFADGMSCGGAITLMKQNAGVEIRGQLRDRKGRGCQSRCSHQLSRPTRGFTIIEVLVALALVAVSVIAIQQVMSTNARGVRKLEQHVALEQMMRAVMNTDVPQRNALRTGETSGQTMGLSLGHRDQAARRANGQLPRTRKSTGSPNWSGSLFRSASGATSDIRTVRLVQRAASQ